MNFTAADSSQALLKITQKPKITCAKIGKLNLGIIVNTSDKEYRQLERYYPEQRNREIGFLVHFPCSLPPDFLSWENIIVKRHSKVSI